MAATNTQSSNSSEEESTKITLQNPSKTCYMHTVSVKTEEIQDFSARRWATYRNCIEQWLYLSGEDKTTAEAHKHCISIDFGSIPQDAGFHATCYRRFINKKRLVTAEKRKRKQSDRRETQESNSVLTRDAASTTGSSETPPKKPRSRMDQLIVSSGPFPPAFCIICREVDKYITEAGKRTKDRLSLAQTLTAGLLLKAAEMKKDTGVLSHIKDKDCAAMEVRYHRSCYRGYTRFLTKPTATVTGATEDEISEPAFDVSYKIFYEQVIRQRIIVNQELLTMNQLRRMFINMVKEHEDIDASNYSMDSLKRRLTLAFPQLVFHSSSKHSTCELGFSETLPVDKLIHRLPQPSGAESTQSTTEAKRKLSVSDPKKPRLHSQSAKIKRCNLYVPSQTDDSTYTANKWYYKKSLCYLTKKFMTLLKQATDGQLDLNQVSQMLETTKRRIYDVTSVLQGINVIKKKSKNVIKLLAGYRDSKHAVGDLVEEEWRLDELIASCTEELHQLFMEHQRFAYLTHEDVSKMDGLKDQTVIVIKAPAGTKVEVSHPHERHQVHVSSTLGPIEVFTCSDSSGPTEKATRLYSAVSGND